MIKKNTKVIFIDGGNERSGEMVGGIPLSKGETIKVHQNGEIIKYEVTAKDIECFFENDDQVVNITYTVRKI